MKKSLLVGVFALSASLAPSAKVLAQAPFEGTVVWSMTMPQLDEEKHEMLINIKGDKTEMEMDLGAQGKISIFNDNVKHKTYMVMAAMHMGFELPTPEDKTPTKEDEVDLKATGKKATVAGHSAEEFTVATEKGDMTLWASNDFPKEVREGFQKAMAANSRGGKKQNRAFKQLAEKGMFPVKMEVKDAGETQMSMELVKLDQKKLDDAIFTPPTDIKFQPMPKGPGGGQD